MALYDHKDAENPVLDAGEYDAFIEKSESYTSKKDVEMRKLKVVVYHEGQEVHLFDYINMAWKYKNLAELTGQQDIYKQDAFDPNDHCQGVNCRVKLSVKEDPQYGKQNQIQKYIACGDATEPAKPARTIPITNTRSGAGGYAAPKGAPKPEDIEVPFN